MKLKIAIMQPYFFPYIGYFQLLNTVDKFIFYDDVNYIKSGWINRNRLFLAGAVRYMTVPLIGASSFEKINKIVIKDQKEWAQSLKSSIHQSYSKAPFYLEAMALFDRVLSSHDGTLSSLARASVIETSKYLGLETQFVMSSQSYQNHEKKSTERIIDICKIENATEYWNLPGGRELYNSEEFRGAMIDLKFINPKIDSYTQFSPDFTPGLSIIDVLMFNDSKTLNAMISTGKSGGQVD